MKGGKHLVLLFVCLFFVRQWNDKPFSCISRYNCVGIGQVWQGQVKYDVALVEMLMCPVLNAKVSCYWWVTSLSSILFLDVNFISELKAFQMH